jgi:hypothetical protein
MRSVTTHGAAMKSLSRFLSHLALLRLTENRNAYRARTEVCEKKPTDDITVVDLGDWEALAAKPLDRGISSI